MPISQRRELLTLYKHIYRVPPADVTQPAPHGPPLDALRPAQDVFLYIYSSSSKRDANSTDYGFISLNRAKMQQHVNQQHNVKLMRWSSPTAASDQEHAAKLWQPVKMQTFFRERRYVRYFVVQEDAQAQQGDEQQGGEQQGGEQQSNYKQTLAYLYSSLAALKREDSEAINRIAEEASAKDHTGWFKRTQWDEHLQAYPDWKLLAYAIRPPCDEEPALKEVVLLVEELVEQAVHGLGTLSIDTLRWLQSAKLNEPDIRPLGRMQNEGSQQSAARLWARLVCYCIRLVAAEDEEEQRQQHQHQQRRQQKKLSASHLKIHQGHR